MCAGLWFPSKPTLWLTVWSQRPVQWDSTEEVVAGFQVGVLVYTLIAVLFHVVIVIGVNYPMLFECSGVVRCRLIELKEKSPGAYIFMTPIFDIKTKKKYILLFKIYRRPLNITGKPIFLIIKSFINNAHLEQIFWNSFSSCHRIIRTYQTKTT